MSETTTKQCACGQCYGGWIREYDGLGNSRRAPCPNAPAASAPGETTEREEWVVQNGLHDEPGVWEDLSEWDYEEQARNALVANREHTDSDLFRWRLVHRRITETVIEGASEQ